MNVIRAVIGACLIVALAIELIAQAKRVDPPETDEEIRRRGILAALRAWELKHDGPKGEGSGQLRIRSPGRRK